MSLDRLMKSADYLAYGFMGMRFRDLVKEDKKLEGKDLEFLIRVIDFFESVKIGRKSSNTLKIGSSTVKDLDNYLICLDIIPKMFNDEEMKKFDKIINSFISNIKTTLEIGEIISKGLKKERDFFIELQRYCIHKNAYHSMRCH